MLASPFSRRSRATGHFSVNRRGERRLLGEQRGSLRRHRWSSAAMSDGAQSTERREKKVDENDIGVGR